MAKYKPATVGPKPKIGPHAGGKSTMGPAKYKPTPAVGKVPKGKSPLK